MKWKLLLISCLLVLGLLAVPIATYACPSSNSASGQVLSGVGQTGSDCSGAGVNKTISTAVTILSIVVGAAAIIMVLVSGIKYISSGGDSAKVSSAKSTLIYALVGVAIAAVAQLLVHFILFQSNKSL
jgi:uncharacterized membrane protein YuzA (DUF378 family)